jgi:hypothetical protein
VPSPRLVSLTGDTCDADSPALGYTGAVRGHRLLLGIAGVALCAWSGWVSVFHRSTAPAEITWVLSLGAVIAVDLTLWRGTHGKRFGWHLPPVDNPWPRPGRGGSRLALRGVAPWIVLSVVALAWDVLGIDTGPHQYHLTISALAQAYRPLNAALLLVWMLAGIGYEAARARAPVGDTSIPTSPATPDPDTPGPGATLGAGMLTLGGHSVGPGLLLPSSPPIGVAFWIAVPIAGLLVDLVARRSHGRVANAEEFVRFISTPMAANVLLVAAWVFAGYHLFAR